MSTHRSWWLPVVLCAIRAQVAGAQTNATDTVRASSNASSAEFVRACFVPRSGTIYRIGFGSAPAACLSTAHVEFAFPSSTVVGARGEKGDQGDRGEPGLKGDRGEAGIKGDRGESGARGETGAPGAQGPVGAPGAAGAAGPIGPIGPQGPLGAAGVQGPIGPQGPIGATGVQGPMGPAGPVGPVGLVGPVGPKGDTGDLLSTTELVEGEWSCFSTTGGCATMDAEFHPGDPAYRRATATCPNGMIAAGGGYSFSETAVVKTEYRVFRSSPDVANKNPRVWVVDAWSKDLGDEFRVRAFATCVAAKH